MSLTIALLFFALPSWASPGTPAFPIIFRSKTAVFSLDDQMRIRASLRRGGKEISLQRGVKPYYQIKSEAVDGWKFSGRTSEPHQHASFGSGHRETLTYQLTLGGEPLPIDLACHFAAYARFPASLISDCVLQNNGTTALKITALLQAQLELEAPAQRNGKSALTLFQGIFPGNYQDDYAAIPLAPGYRAENFLGVMDPHRDPHGGGIPLLDVWSPEMGISISHVSPKPEFLKMPVSMNAAGIAKIGIEESFDGQGSAITLPPGGSFQTVPALLTVHQLDYFDPLRAYAEVLGAQGPPLLKAAPQHAPSSYWKTWGYEKNFSVANIIEKLPELKELGIEMVVLDDGWFSNYGDWLPSRAAEKFPGGEADLVGLIKKLHREGFKVGLWWSPLIAEPGSAVAKEHPDWLMWDQKKSPYLMKEPDSNYLCPSLPAVQKFWAQQIDKFYKDWDIDYIYHDWAELIGVPPCHNPAHAHSSPLQPFWEFPKQFERIFAQIQSIKPGSGVEMCECGRPHDPYKMPFYNISNASDPKSIDDILLKLKVEKALNGSKSYFSVGYVLPEQLYDYDPGTMSLMLGTGSLFQTYYKKLRPETKRDWVKMLRLYRKLKLYEGEYLNLYDVAYDKPQVHALKKGRRIYYYVPGKYSGQLELRGLDPALKYSVVNYVTEEKMGKVTAQDPKFSVDFDDDLLLVATPM